ncbi:MAG: hypothetical protein EBU90_06520 [Proteobacteria bacterium]|nr:hypothetical protein [Pseudomonadota bacterium]
MKTLVISGSKQIAADFNVGTVFDAINIIKNNNLSIIMLDNELQGNETGVDFLKKILFFSKYNWIKLPQQIIIIESDEAVKKEMQDLVKQIYYC